MADTARGNAHEHIEHCDVLITGCLTDTDQGRALGVCVAFDEDLSGLDLLAVSETLVTVAARIGALASERAQAN